MAAQEYALRAHVAVALGALGARSDNGVAPFRAAVRATFEFFETDKATATLLVRDSYACGDRFEEHLGCARSDGGLHTGRDGRAVGAPAAQHRRRCHPGSGGRLRRRTAARRAASAGRQIGTRIHVKGTGKLRL
jgi:hypothetical protein